MADLTPTLGLVKPTMAENIDLDVFNGNMDKIDTAIGAPSSEIADIQTKVESIVAPPTVYINPAFTGPTYTAGQQPDAKLNVSKVGKIAICYYAISWVPNTYGTWQMTLPDQAANYAAYDQAIGAFSVFTNSNTFVNGVVMLIPASNKIYFRCAQTLNTSSTWSTVYGESNTGLVTGTRHYLGAEFSYELA